MGKLVAVEHHGPDFRLFEHGELGVHLADSLFAEADVKNLEFADELLVFGEQEGELLLLKGEREVCLDDVGAYIISVVFGHET